MDFLAPRTLAEALRLRAEHPDALPIAGGTDVMVELNFDRRRPPALLDLTRVPELTGWARDGDAVRIGATLPYTAVLDELADLLPGLAAASRTVGSPQIRNRGTVGGNLGSASPAGDAHPVLLATGATVELTSLRGTRQIPAEGYFHAPRRTAIAPDELITAVRVPVARGPQRYAKIGPRNAMVIAVCSLAVALDLVERRVGTGIGSAGPTPLRAPEAEEYLESELTALDWWDRPGAVPAATAQRFGELVAAAARPIDDLRGTAVYRRHALRVLARRSLGWVVDEQRAAA